MSKTKEQLIAVFKKSNKERRMKIAKAAGFSNPEDYLASLTNIKVSKTKKKTTSKMKGVFYVIDILDATGSMDGGKYNNSVQGIKDGIKDLFNRSNIRYSLVEFIDSSKGLNRSIKNAIPKNIVISNIKFSGAIGYDTPLYWTVYEIINEIREIASKDDKVLINVYTDGGNNTRREYLDKAAELIKKVQKDNFTVTFVATPEDLVRIKRDINIDDSNTLATENTAQGFKMSMEKTRTARTAYFSASSAGEDTLVGFYKKQETL